MSSWWVGAGRESVARRAQEIARAQGDSVKNEQKLRSADMARLRQPKRRRKRGKGDEKDR